MKARSDVWIVSAAVIGLVTFSAPVGAARQAAKRSTPTTAAAIYPQYRKNGQSVRWIREQMPIKVWIARGLTLDGIPDPVSGNPITNTANTSGWPDAVMNVVQNQQQFSTLPIAELYSEEQYMAALQGIYNWKFLEKEGLLNYELTENPDEADIYVFWTDNFVHKLGLALLENDTRGITAKYLLPTSVVKQAIARNDLELVRRSLKPVVILLRTAGPDRVPLPFNKVKAASAHEFGHALGIDGHSPYPTDLMSLSYGRGVVSANDAATIRYLYRNPAELMP